MSPLSAGFVVFAFRLPCSGWALGPFLGRRLRAENPVPGERHFAKGERQRVLMQDAL